MAMGTANDGLVRRRQDLAPYQRGDYWPRRFRRQAMRPRVVQFLRSSAGDDDDPQATHAIQRAIQYQREGRLAEAEEVYREVLLRQPRDPSVLHGLGQILRLQNRSEAAIEFLRWAVAEVPDCVEFRLDLAAALAAVENPQESEREVRIALQFKPDCIEAWCQLGEVLELQGKLREALAVFHQAFDRFVLHDKEPHNEDVL